MTLGGTARAFIAHGEYTIAKYRNGDGFAYLLWRGNELLAGPFATANQARKHADGLKKAA